MQYIPPRFYLRLGHHHPISAGKTVRGWAVVARKINSHQKGKRGELEWSHFCRSQGYAVRRTAQYCGKTGEASDCVGLPGIHQEVKRTEKLNLYAAMSQAVRDSAKSGSIPIVAHRKNDHEWLVIMRAADWFPLYREWELAHPPRSEEAIVKSE